MSDKRGWLLALGVVCLAFGASLSGCLQSSGLVCLGGTVECNVTCVYLSTDPANCGACGSACQPRAVCVPIDDGGSGECQCRQGEVLPDGGTTILLCNGTCTDITTDPKNCGGCAGAGGATCGPSQVCAPTDAGGGACETNCGTAVECNGSCVTLSTDSNNCGACGNVCAQGYGCHPTPNGPTVGACLPDLVVSCIATPGTVAPIFASATQPLAGPGVPGGSVPGGLGQLGNALLVGAEGQLLELALPNLLLRAPESPLLGSGPDFVEVDTRLATGSWVYVVDGNANTLMDFSGPPSMTASVFLPDGGLQGLGLDAGGAYAFGSNTVPEPYARVGDEIFVPLYGGYPPTQVNGGTVVRLNVSHPSTPALVGTYDLKSVPLQTFDGGSSDPRPSQALFHGGYVYVVLNNLTVDSNGFYVPAGPSVLAKIDPLAPLADAGAGDAGIGTISQLVTLDAGVCLDAISLAETSGGRLLVACFGQAQFNPTTFATVSVDRSALLLLDSNDDLLSAWSTQCPDAGTGGSSCIPPILGTVAAVGGQAYVGDQSSGRLFVVDIGQTALTQLVGYGPDGGVPLQPCAPGTSSVSDILVVP